MTFRLGEALAEFRHRVEQVYAWAGEPFDPEIDDSDTIPDEPVPEVVETTLKAVSRLANALPKAIGGRPGLDRVVEALGEAAADARKRLVRYWHKRGHRDRIRNRRGQQRRTAGEADRVLLTLGMLAGSPVGPDTWGPYELVARTFESGLPGDYQPLFALGRLLGRVVFPSAEDHVTAADNENWDRVARMLRPAVRATLGWAAAGVPRLGVLRVSDADDDVNELYRLRTAIAGELGRTADVGVAASPVSSVDPAEYDRLAGMRADLLKAVAAKRQTTASRPTADVGGYVGDSVPILKVFEQIDICRNARLRAVLLLGPKGTGKTTLAHVIHHALVGSLEEVGAPSNRPAEKKAGENATRGHLLRWQASHSQASDPLGPRSHWIGFAKNSGYQNVPPDGKPGLLQECDGGSIFIDEFGDLHPDVQTLLLDVAEGREVIPIGGTPQEAYKPNVCLILATNKDVRAAVRDDLLDRIGMKIRLPPLRDRPEDIFPLVRHYLVGPHRPSELPAKGAEGGGSDGPDNGPAFTLSLRTWALFLAHDWPGNVRELEQTLKLVRAAYEVKAKRRRSAPRGKTIELPHELFLEESEGLRDTAARVGDVPADAAEYRLFNLLKGILEARGYRASTKASTSRPLFTLMGELLGMKKSKVSRLKQRAEAFEARVLAR